MICIYVYVYVYVYDLCLCLFYVSFILYMIIDTFKKYIVDKLYVK